MRNEELERLLLGPLLAPRIAPRVPGDSIFLRNWSLALLRAQFRGCFLVFGLAA